MSVIYLKHELHGAKVAISEDEAVADEKNGWERYELAEPSAPVVSDELSNALASTPRRQRKAA